MSKSNITLKVGGKALELNPAPPSVLRLARFLDGQPPDALFTSPELAVKAEWALNSIVKYSNNQPELVDYRQTFRHKMYWGSRKAIAELRRQAGLR